MDTQLGRPHRLQTQSEGIPCQPRTGSLPATPHPCTSHRTRASHVLKRQLGAQSASTRAFWRAQATTTGSGSATEPPRRAHRPAQPAPAYRPLTAAAADDDADDAATASPPGCTPPRRGPPPQSTTR